MALVAFATSSWANAQMRPFTNDNGTVIQAELVSHKGDKVKLKRTDGKEFEVNPAIFSDEDEAYIKNWVAKTPATKNYNFKIAISKKKMEGNSMNMGYKRVKNDLWSYVLAVTNNSQDTVSNLTIKY
ncbi:MAG: y domain 1, partial [Verrucomicrobiota bacterium]